MTNEVTGRIVDVVCGMDVSDFSDAPKHTYKGSVFSFCGDGCEKRFLETPARFQGEPFLKLSNIKKSFITGGTETKVLRGINLHVWEGDFVAIIGASGSGKSTLLNMIGLLDRPTRGEIFLQGREMAHLDDEDRTALRSKTFGFVFQQYNLIPWLTAYENITIPALFSGVPLNEESIAIRVAQAGLSGRLLHRPTELSGGEQQRVALLRALTNDPEVILGDEPTGNLDSATGNAILDMLIGLNRTQKKTLIVVTHDADIAARADEIITLKDGEMVRDHRVHRAKYTE